MSENRVQITIVADGRNAEQAVRSLNGQLSGLDGQTRQTGSGMRDLSSQVDRTGSSMLNLGAIAKGVMGYFAVGTILNFGRGLTAVASQFETLEISLKTVTGSFQATEQAMSWITEFTAKTPYELEQVGAAFRKLTAYGMDAVQFLPLLGDTASAMGKSLNDAVEMFADAATGEFERLKEFGVRAKQEGEQVTFAWQENGRQMTASAAKTQADITAELAKIFKRFQGGMEEQSKSLAGMKSNMADIWTLWKKEVMDNGPFEALKLNMSETLTYFQSAVGEMELKEWAESTASAILNTFEVASYGVQALAYPINGIKGAFNVLKLGIVEIEELALDMYMGVYKYLPGSISLTSEQIAAMRAVIAQTRNEANEGIEDVEKGNQAIAAMFSKFRGNLEQSQAVGTSTSAALAQGFSDVSTSIEGSTKAVDGLSKKTKKLFAELDKMQEAALLKQTAATDRVIQLREGMTDAAKRAQAYISMLDQKEYDEKQKLAEKLKQEREKELEEQERAAQRTMERIQDATADVFFDLFKNVGDGWSSLWSSMKDWALRTLAELAAKAATARIIVPIITTLTGAGTANAAVNALSGGSGGFDVSSLTNLVSPGSMLSKIPGMNAITGILGMQLPGTTMLSGGALSLAAGGTAGGNIASLAAAQNLAGMTGGLSLGAALGMGSLGGLGYSLLGGALGLPQNQWSGITSGLGGALGAWGGSALASSAAGAALGATAGSVLPIVGTAVGAILGGLGSSLFGGKEHSPSVIFQKNETKWGQTSGFQFHTKDGADWATGEQIAASLGKVAGTVYDQVDALLTSLGDGYVDQLKDATITWGRHASDDFGWDFGSDHDFEELFKQASTDLQRRIYEAAAPVLSRAGADYLDSDAVDDAYALLSDGSGQFAELTEIIRQGVQGGDLETYASQLKAFQAAITTVTQTWDAVSKASAELVTPLTQYEQAQRSINNQYDTWIAQLEALGIAETQLNQIEADRHVILTRLAQENAASIDAVVSAAHAAAYPLSEYEQAQRSINSQYDGWIAQLKALGAATERITQVEADRAVALDALQAQMQANIAAAQAAQASSIRQAQAEVSGTVGQYQIQQIAERYKWDSTYISDGQLNRANIERDALEWFKSSSVDKITAGAAWHGVEVDQLLADIKYLDQHFKQLDSVAKTTVATTATSYDRISTAVDRTADEFARLTKALVEYRQELLATETGGGTVAERYLYAQSEFDRIADLAAGGDLDALGRLQAVSDNYLSVAKDFNATAGGYQADVNAVLAALDLGATAGAKQSGQDLAALRAEVQGLRDDTRAGNYQMAKIMTRMQTIWQRWDVEGQPEVRQ